MRFDIHYRPDLKAKIKATALAIREWNQETPEYRKEIEDLAQHVTPFEHCALPDHDFLMAGADGSGDFPCATYGDSFVYLVVAIARMYAATKGQRGLDEISVKDADLLDVLWLPEDQEMAKKLYDEFFERIVCMPLEEICKKSDYRDILKSRDVSLSTISKFIEQLIRPAGHDAGNIRTQMLGTEEVAALLKVLRSKIVEDKGDKPVYVIEDRTLALPTAYMESSLFFEIARRYACVLASEKAAVYMTLSKSHDMPRMDLIEEMVKKVVPSEEHWFMRVPGPYNKEAKPKFLETRAIPPDCAVTYIFRLHKSTGPLRLDLDYKYWKKNIWNTDANVMRSNEIQLFRDLDVASHDYRCFGYPYPIKASHDMASLTQDERVVLRKQVRDICIDAGLKPKNFFDASMQTGHK